MTSETLPSSTDDHTDNVNASQLKVLLLNYLRNGNISEIPDAKNIPKLNLYHICKGEILTHPPQAFTILSCDHIFHQTCLEKYIIRTKSRSPKCPVCPEFIETIREEFAHASGEFHLVCKDYDSVNKASQVSTDTIENDYNALKYIRELGLVEDDRPIAGQEKQVDKPSMQDQARSSITDERNTIVTSQVRSEGQTSPDENTESHTQTQLRQLSPKISCEQDTLQGLLKELSTPIKGESAEINDDFVKGSENSISKNLVRLYQKACSAET
ncbi:18623_t:CDS:1, partial [Dentiscutata erythropus]